MLVIAVRISNYYIYYYNICLKLLSLLGGCLSLGVHQKPTLIQGFG